MMDQQLQVLFSVLEKTTVERLDSLQTGFSEVLLDLGKMFDKGLGVVYSDIMGQFSSLRNELLSEMKKQQEKVDMTFSMMQSLFTGMQQFRASSAAPAHDHGPSSASQQRNNGKEPSRRSTPVKSFDSTVETRGALAVPADSRMEMGTPLPETPDPAMVAKTAPSSALRPVTSPPASASAIAERETSPSPGLPLKRQQQRVTIQHSVADTRTKSDAQIGDTGLASSDAAARQSSPVQKAQSSVDSSLWKEDDSDGAVESASVDSEESLSPTPSTRKSRRRRPVQLAAALASNSSSQGGSHNVVHQIAKVLDKDFQSRLPQQDAVPQQKEQYVAVIHLCRLFRRLYSLRMSLVTDPDEEFAEGFGTAAIRRAYYRELFSGAWANLLGKKLMWVMAFRPKKYSDGRWDQELGLDGLENAMNKKFDL